MYWLRYDTMCSTGKIMSLVWPSCRFTPLTLRCRPRFCGSPASSAVTSHGPSGLKVSQDLPRSHCEEYSNWNSRSETSWLIAYPAITFPAASGPSR